MEPADRLEKDPLDDRAASDALSAVLRAMREAVDKRRAPIPEEPSLVPKAEE